jgi:DNA-directed RNA polymerase subunit RPC12/RpoP
MNCPKCKSPIADNSQECEWCGFKIITKPKEKIAHDDENGLKNEEVEENKSRLFGILLLPALCLLAYIVATIVNYFR